MKAKPSKPPSESPRKKPDLDTYRLTLISLQDAVNKVVFEVGIIETLANAAGTVSGIKGDNEICRRRLGDLAMLVENAARDALVTAHELSARFDQEAALLG